MGKIAQAKTPAAPVVEPVAPVEPEAAPAAARAPRIVFKACECGCGGPTQRRFVPGHDAKHAASIALAARAAAAGRSVEDQVALDAEDRKSAARAKGAARRAADKAAALAAWAALSAPAEDGPAA